MYAVCSRYPEKLASSVKLETVQRGVYLCERGSDQIRIVVAGEVPDEPHNALLNLFSASAERASYGAAHYQQRSPDTNSLLPYFLENYREEGINMSYTMADFRHDNAKEQFNRMTSEERQEWLRTLSEEELLAALPPEAIAKLLERLKGEPGSKGQTTASKLTGPETHDSFSRWLYAEHAHADETVP